MPDMYLVRITPRALADLEQIFEYIRRDSPQNATVMIAKLIDAIDGLNILPHRFDVPRVGMVGGRQVRSMPVRPYLVRYRIDETRRAVYVLRVAMARGGGRESDYWISHRWGTDEHR
jgi:addiction module RelE/StbE family toxin